MQFQGFKPEAMQRIAGTLGYDGDMSQFDGYLESNPEAKQKMGMYNQQAVSMMNGGMVRINYEEGGTVPQIKKDTIDRMKNPSLPTGGKTTATGTVVQGDQLISSGTGTVSGRDPEGKVQTAYASSASATDPRTQKGYFGIRDYAAGSEGQIRFGGDQPRSTTDTGVFKTDTVKSGDSIDDELDKTTAVEGTVSDGATVGAEQTTESSVSDLTTTEGMSIDVKEVADRKMEIGERVDPVADAASAATFTEEIQAATATPTEKATVKGQLAELMTDFEGKPRSGLYRDDRGQIVDESGRPVAVQNNPNNPNAYDNLPSLSEAKAEAKTTTPAWAAGAMRAATTAMAARGLGASSMAGQALVQAAMESAIPIAMADAGTFAKFESQNLSNRQQRAMLAAEQRATFMGQEFDQKFQARVMNAAKVSDVANMNFNAEQQVALENSRAANTMALANLSNEQALLMGEVAALSN